ncbi:sodium-coupled monocarboxylate transporter 1 [Ceratina calcarata]|uniref:Sodium-coupled monocarboxylate transporter 1 n=1 Tax=Ceratina calcarata TaxID=156304 RepID=A0AAJ7ND39_9HYME|nr:sodium-coupled monocarboxylate transporter 1 [Ceratina calcarata]XP_017888481.1 sodium-coupled monocarboxylate transporter 1 [Ceratina calcarata]XP_017888482.1 sodium-coupled monocarboxylate transporter 1 [Ceratina calcarata]XP_017888484.1 sodium-coupled monocarboxylate transporter 1 [Ceratina calcarata]XP_017888485.1 sodium-coupled monocarboxylate transporter 1 [Ceratina calcarata]XP_017888486.1 sodium-coupled monocarboxylate transporter 1 [Ceratina calcarata]XP_017888487.1 sodium-coupled
MLETQERGYFHWADWLVFALMLVVSAAAGLWHYRRAQKSSTEDYLLGGRSMALFPVSASLVASFISGVTILGTPSEIYNFGTQYWITIISIFFSGLVVALVYAPVFVNLGLNSVYEYLEIRFNRGVRTLISLIFVIDVVLYQSIVIYVPALALNQVSGINVHLIGVIVCLVCVFYTVLGGIRAVVWTDALQVGVMIAGVLTVTALGTYQIGAAEIWKRAQETGRIQFLNFDTSPYARHTVWTVLIGSWLYSTAYIAVNQTMVQRYRSLKDLKTSKLSLAIFTISIMLFISLCCWCGLVLLAWWAPPKCDPRATGLITADDQLLPAYVMQVAKDLHGVPGLFIAAIFGAALSTLSVGFNSTSVVVLEDFIKGCFGMKLSDRCSTIFVKCLVVVLGSIAMGLLFLVEKLGGVLVITGSLAAIAAGTSFGVFTLGILFPWANSKGAFMGAIVGFLIAGWASLGANWSLGAGLLVPKKLSVPLSHCPGNISESFRKQFDHPDEDEVFPLYRLSYHWFTGLGTLIVIVVGSLISFWTGPTNPATVDKKLFSPLIHSWLPKPKHETVVNAESAPGTSETKATTNLLLSDLKKKRRNQNFPNGVTT